MCLYFFFFFNATATTEIYTYGHTLSLHDALPISNAVRVASDPQAHGRGVIVVMGDAVFAARDVRKAATSNIDAFKGFPRGPLARVTPARSEEHTSELQSLMRISYAVFCLKKKNKNNI